MWGSMENTIHHQSMGCDSAREIWKICELITLTKIKESVCVMFGTVCASLWKFDFCGLLFQVYYLFDSASMDLFAFFSWYYLNLTSPKMIFLKGLRSSLFSPWQQITSQSTLPSIDKVFFLVSSDAHLITLHCLCQRLLVSAMVSQSAQGDRGQDCSWVCGFSSCHSALSNGSRNVGRGSMVVLIATSLFTRVILVIHFIQNFVLIVILTHLCG